MTIAQRLHTITARVAAAEAAAGRAPGSVSLLAVSKTRSIDEINQAAAAGQREFGESRAQELRDKRAACPALSWHFIGPLQKNKIKYLVGKVALIHSVDTLALAAAISDRAQRVETAPVSVLLQVNIGQEDSKRGAAPEQALAVAAAMASLPGISLRGLMAIPPRVSDPRDAAPWFAAMAALAAEGRARGLPLEELSMGMSSDFAVAIAHGATLVRVGTAIFGPRLQRQRGA